MCIKELILDVKGNIFLIVDNVSYNKSAEVNTCVEQHSNRI